MTLERDEHVVLVGPNGAGKTTLIEALAGRGRPAAGKVAIGHNVELGYLSQHAESASGHGTVLEAAQRGTGLTGQKVRDLLGGFLFSGKDVEKRLDDLSGGEQRRLSLAILVASGANVLILDEPTNHLDLESREALEDALREFPGAVLLVSHDRALLEAVGGRTLVVEDGGLRSFPGPWAEYRRAEEERAAAEREAAAAAKPTAGRGRKGRTRRGVGPSKNALRRVAELEREIERAEAELSALEDELADPSAWASPGGSERASARHAEAKRRVEELMRRWEQAAEPAAQR